MKSSNIVNGLATSSSSKKELEQKLAQLGLGILVALQEGDLSLESAEEGLFNLDTYLLVEKRRLSPRLLELLQWGMELEDVVALGPKALQESFEQMSFLARQIIAESTQGKRSLRRRTAKEKTS